jgi:NADH-quinone oxidoreductase subunit E
MPELPAPDYPDDVRARLERDAREVVARYPDSRSALLPLLHLVQSEEGHVTRTGMRFCAETLGLTTAEVTAVATFYTMYRRKPSGDYQVGVCTNTLCAVMASATARPPTTARSPWSTSSATRPATTRRS